MIFKNIAAAEMEYVDISGSVIKVSNASIAPRLISSTILDVGHVAQTGVCGVAAWAAILNYRFGTNYTNHTLAYSMFSYGYIPSFGATPVMGAYPAYANFMYSAGAVDTTTPSVETVRLQINAGKPLMGNWTSPRPGSPSIIDTHAVIIKGFIYEEIGLYRKYVLKNPHYTYSQIISVMVTIPSAVYLDNGYSWTLIGAAY